MNATDLQRSVPYILILSLTLGLTGLVRGQTPVASPATVSATTATAEASDGLPALRIAISAASESRDSQVRATLNLLLSVQGDGLPPNAALKRITVTNAVDNLGNVLSPITAVTILDPLMNTRLAVKSFSVGGALSLASVGRPSMTAQLSLNAPVRKAESLKFLEGTIELELPYEAKGATVRIPNVLSRTGRIEDPALARHSLEFYFLPDQASYEQMRSQVAGFQAGTTQPDFSKSVGYFFRDPLGRVHSAQLQDAQGKVIPTKDSWWHGGPGSRAGTFHFSAPLPADAQLVLLVPKPEVRKTVPFRVDDIALP